MDWIYLTLIVAFVCWSVQIVMAFRRQSNRISDQILAARSNQDDLEQQAQDLEAQAVELTVELKALQSETHSWDEKQKVFEEKVKSVQEKEAHARPSRHRVDLPPDES